MQLSEQEKEAIKKITAISLKDYATIKDIFFSILSYISIDAHCNQESEVIIPYICKLKIKYDESPVAKGFESKVYIEAEALPSLVKEYINIKNGEEPPSKKYFRKQNSMLIDKYINKGDLE